MSANFGYCSNTVSLLRLFPLYINTIPQINYDGQYKSEASFNFLTFIHSVYLVLPELKLLKLAFTSNHRVATNPQIVA